MSRQALWGPSALPAALGGVKCHCAVRLSKQRDTRLGCQDYSKRRIVVAHPTRDFRQGFADVLEAIAGWRINFACPRVSALETTIQRQASVGRICGGSGVYDCDCYGFNYPRICQCVASRSVKRIGHLGRGDRERLIDSTLVSGTSGRERRTKILARALHYCDTHVRGLLLSD
jgi:hypothetical protein